MDEILEYDFRNTRYQSAKKYKPDPKCNSILVTNIGTTVCSVNGFPLGPGIPGTRAGESFSLGGNRKEIFRPSNQYVQIEFPGGNGDCIVTEKFYIK